MITKKDSFLLLLFAPLLGFLLASCHFNQDSTPSVIVIAVDQLGVNQVNCTSESPSQVRSGMALLCQESVRFTHAYTTSPLSGPALTSILTAQYPFEHGLRSNTKSSLPSRVTTLPELAQSKGYVTSFFSGGAPVLRKLNLQQGFETFDDAINPTPGHLFRSFRRTQKIFESWLHDIGHQKFFSVFYVPDMSFTNNPTQTPMGENRNLSYDSQLEEFDEVLYNFIQDLKSKNRWDSTMLILVGLNGPDGGARGTELLNLNLFSEKTQVGLLIKPSQKPRDQGINWSFDENVSLADVGATLAEVFGSLAKTSATPVLSLLDVLKTPSPKLAVNRPIVIESGWMIPESVRYAVRWGQYLFLLNEQPQAYNSLIDKLETTPVRIAESGMLKEWESIQKLILAQSWTYWPGISKDEYLKWKGLSDLWATDPTIVPPVSFERLAHRLRDIPEVTSLYSRELLNQQNWSELERWSQGLKLNDLEKLAMKNQKRESKIPFKDPCLAVLELSRPQNTDLKRCEDPTALTLLEWFFSEKLELFDANTRESLRKKFLRQYVLLRLDQKVVETNYALQGVWDLAPNLKNKSLTVEMMLGHPDLQKYRQMAVKAFQQAKED